MTCDGIALVTSSVADSAFDGGPAQRARIRFVSSTILILAMLLLGLSFATAPGGGRTAFGSMLGADFAGFYTAGWILNHHQPAQLYDNAFQDEIHHHLHPHLGMEEKLPYLHPPFVAWAFRPFALLPYRAAFALWLLVSLAVYLFGLMLTFRGIPMSAADRRSVLLLALSFEPFVMECWLGGQLSAVGFCCLAAAVALDRRGRPLLAGLVLGLCLYKPTLLLVVLPMLLAARRFWTLAGVAITGLLLAGLTLVVIGWDGTWAFVDALTGFTRGAAQSGGLSLRTWKYVDLSAFTRAILGPTLAQRLLFGALALPLLGWLLFRAWRTDASNPRQLSLLWAAALLATPVINLYVGVYDSILAVLGALLLMDALGCTVDVMPRRLRFGLVALYLVPWFAQPLARVALVQVFTLVLVALTCYSLRPTDPHSRLPRHCGVDG
jgi:Glycosyltransferase family 87